MGQTRRMVEQAFSEPQGKNMHTNNLMLYLSDSFSAGKGSGCLECTCEVININRGYNGALMEKCHRLWEYSEFSSEIEENLTKGMSRRAAIETAIDTCIEKGILFDILIKQKAEILHMLLTHYDEKKHLRNTFMEGIQKGREDKLRELVQRKLSKGKTISEIADELDEEISIIEQIIKNK